MKAQYFDKNIIRENGKYVGTQQPLVIITMQPSEVDRFQRMMDYIEDTHGVRWKCDLEADDSGVETAYVYVSDQLNGREFFEYYKEAKSEVRR